ncbi:MAG: lipid-A-disaccharide synthase [Hyphomicrobiales bacterium]|nr:lipid-A-disaccharide synthase [Hyphomicrobiales bacterium]
MSERARDGRLTICLVAAEESGSRLGAALMRTLKIQAGAIDFIGIGGEAMAAEGLRSIVPIRRELAYIGFGMIRQLPAIVRHIREIAAAAIAARPDVVVIIDSPELTHRVARRVRKAAPEIPIVNYVSPSVWAWRPGRARAMRAYVDHILALLPFEPAVHARLGGPACSYVGHPLIEQLGVLRPSPKEAARRLADPPMLLALPGSRKGELRRMADTFGEALSFLQSQIGPFEAVVPAVPHLADSVRAASAKWTMPVQVVVDPSEKLAAFRVARAALVKSGTSTLELALAGVPMVAAYKVSLLEEAVARLAINVPSVILANLVLNENVVPELLQRDATPERLAEVLAPLLSESPERSRQLDAFARLDTIMQVGSTPSARAAEIVLRHAYLRREIG